MRYSCVCQNRVYNVDLEPFNAFKENLWTGFRNYISRNSVNLTLHYRNIAIRDMQTKK